MGVLLHVLTYVCMAVFVFAVVAKFMSYQKMPMHLRWELYPVAHEGHKAHYGGSYFEETDWWEKPRVVDHVTEMKHMLPEIFFLTAVKKSNPALWLRTFPFHFGMYLLIGFLTLMMAGAVAQLAGVEVAATGGLGGAIYYGTVVTGFAGCGLGIIGALGLIGRRLFDEDMKDFTKPSDIFNLAFLCSVFTLILISGLADPSFSALRNYVQSIISLDLSYTPVNPAAVAAIISGSLVVAYIPLTHMSHFVVKFFTYHSIRWDDAPNLRGGEYEEKIGEVLQYPITWAADHINPNGEEKTWAQVATEDIKGDK